MLKFAKSLMYKLHIIINDKGYICPKCKHVNILNNEYYKNLGEISMLHVITRGKYISHYCNKCDYLEECKL